MRFAFYRICMGLVQELSCAFSAHPLRPPDPPRRPVRSAAAWSGGGSTRNPAEQRRSGWPFPRLRLYGQCAPAECRCIALRPLSERAMRCKLLVGDIPPSPSPGRLTFVRRITRLGNSAITSSLLCAPSAPGSGSGSASADAAAASAAALRSRSRRRVRYSIRRPAPPVRPTGLGVVGCEDWQAQPGRRGHRGC